MTNKKIIKEIAQQLNNRQYRDETTPEIERIAKANNIVIVFGASDDLIEFRVIVFGASDGLIEFRGVVYDEEDCWEGGNFYFNKNGLITNNCKHNCPHYKEKLEKASEIKAIWNPDDFDYLWIYETDIPHETFDIIEESEKYCRGIVFSLDDVEV